MQLQIAATLLNVQIVPVPDSSDGTSSGECAATTALLDMVLFSPHAETGLMQVLSARDVLCYKS
jgi:hypothetical protein